MFSYRMMGKGCDDETTTIMMMMMMVMSGLATL
jgi:hypothetical protein